jgi:hypothetical protein
MCKPIKDKVTRDNWENFRTLEAGLPLLVRSNRRDAGEKIDGHLYLNPKFATRFIEAIQDLWSEMNTKRYLELTLPSLPLMPMVPDYNPPPGYKTDLCRKTEPSEGKKRKSGFSSFTAGRDESEKDIVSVGVSISNEIIHCKKCGHDHEEDIPCPDYPDEDHDHDGDGHPDRPDTGQS